ncbi:Propionyl-CoA carboxylase, beta subunit [Desulfatibacillum aliphaticivorans]|uniref:Propionyl-CoA carboxylase, beta subunit n=1 Tax=Desulfatibacillum aliphaticivorans TaxID=218208 RepID=B8FFI0_DESAL|nr:carboxyl transferase domain-containing protein [Desulfatibacillum aliphaticivorans]ACL04240.1 Propionyl-CoA carboxylase, beta subunit [Desulfatibacillum aliphaticivorans]
MGKWMDGYLEKLEAKRLKSQQGGGQDRQEVQHSLNKLTARERMELLFDKGAFDELGALTRDARPPLDGKKRPSPGDGVVMGGGQINGRNALAFCLDFTVMAGGLGNDGVWMLADLVKKAGERNVPLIGMLDSAGSRISVKDGYTGLNGLGRLFRYMSQYSGVSPRIMMVLGPCTGPLAALPVMGDFRIFNEESAFLWLGGAMESDEAGTAEFHMEKSGQCDFVVDSDEDAIDKAKELLAYMPQNCWEMPPFVDSGDDPERREEAILDVMPENVKFTYDVHEIIELIVDNGEFLEVQEEYATHLVTGFARIGGYPIGIVANNPDEMSGVFEIDSADKYDRFMNFLDCFNIPIITMVDSTAYVPGDKWERLGIIRHGAKNLHSYSHLTTQKITVVLRRSYGGSNIVMGCAQMHPDVVFGWPCGEFAPTGPESIVEAIFHKELAKAEEKGGKEKRQEYYDMLLATVRERFNIMHHSMDWTSYYMVEEAIDPRDTRAKIYRTIVATLDKQEELPEKKRFIKPA